MSSMRLRGIDGIASAVLVCALVCAAAAPARSSALVVPLKLRAATVTQRGEGVVLTVRTAAPWRPDGSPSGRGGRLCLQLTQAPATTERVCVGGGSAGLRLVTRTARGGWRSTRLPGTAVAAPATRSLVVTFPMAQARLVPGSVAWVLRSTWWAAPCSASRPCASIVRAARGRTLILVVPRVVGCEPAGPSLRFSGSGQAPEVALTFDDGPAADTAAVLTTLEAEHAPATFFVVGSQIGGHEDLLRRMVLDGDAIGDHSFSHADLSGDGPAAAQEMARTATLIGQATGYTPCLFRAPYGHTSQPLVDEARAQGLLSIQWDVDPRDWSLPGTPAIADSVLAQTHDGSIVLMHDGGGPRGQTVAALPAIIDGLRGRGERLVTVPELLGLAPRYAS